MCPDRRVLKRRGLFNSDHASLEDDSGHPRPISRRRSGRNNVDLTIEPKPYEYGLVGRPNSYVSTPPTSPPIPGVGPVYAGSPRPDNASRSSTMNMSMGRPDSTTMLLGASSSPRSNRRPGSTPGQSQPDLLHYGSRSPSPSHSVPLNNSYNRPNTQRRGSQGSSVLIPSRPASVHALGGPRERRISNNSLLNFGGTGAALQAQAQQMDYFAPIGADSNVNGGRPRSLAIPLSPELQTITLPTTRTPNPQNRAEGLGSGSPIAFPSGAVTMGPGTSNLSSPPARPVKSPKRSRATSEILNIGASGGESSTEERHLIMHKDGGRVPSVGTSGEGMTGESGTGAGTGSGTGEGSGDGEGPLPPAFA